MALKDDARTLRLLIRQIQKGGDAYLTPFIEEVERIAKDLQEQADDEYPGGD